MIGFLWRYIKEYRVTAILAPLFKMLEAIFELLVPLVMAKMIDIGIPQRDFAFILRQSLVLLLLALAGMIFSITAQYFAARAAVLSAGRMRGELFCHIMDFSADSMDDFGEKTLLSRITSDLNAVQGGINMFLRLFLRSPFVVFGAMIMAGTISRGAMLLFAVVIALLILVISLIMKTTIPMYTKVQRSLDGIFTLVSENLEGMRPIRAFALEEDEIIEFERRNSRLQTEARTAGCIQALLNPLTFALVNLGIIVLLVLGGAEVGRGHLLRGEVVALYNYMTQILVELVKLALLLVQITRAFSSAERIREVMEHPADQRTFERIYGSDDENAISFDEVSFAYVPEKRAISDITFKVAKGETLGIVGSTGAGKSTIAHIMRHAYDASSGSVELFGRPVDSMDDNEISRVISVVPQSPMLMRGTIRSNLALGDSDTGEADMIRALKCARAYDFVMKKGGLDSEVKAGGSNFSGGQRQRLAIARALCKNPGIIIMDDATSALDAATERSLLGALAERRDLTKVIISQRSSSVINADNILVIDGGWCVGSGSHGRLLENNEVYREIYNAQAS